jgi:hypothetical protein
VAPGCGNEDACVAGGVVRVLVSFLDREDKNVVCVENTRGLEVARLVSPVYI